MQSSCVRRELHGNSKPIIKRGFASCVLSVIDKEPVYGYELAQKLKESGLPEISDGTVYPILLRLQKNKLIYSETRPSMTGGPKRKYYFMTEGGKEELKQISDEWEALSIPISTLLRGTVSGERASERADR